MSDDFEAGYVPMPPMTSEQKRRWDEAAEANMKAIEEMMANPGAKVEFKVREYETCYDWVKDTFDLGEPTTSQFEEDNEETKSDQ